MRLFQKKANKRSPPQESTHLPMGDRLAVRQARVVLFYAFVIGLVLSLAQILNDYVSQKGELKGTLEQLTESIKQPAANSVWFVDSALAVGVIDGLLGYEPILSAKLVHERGVLLEKAKEAPAATHSPLVKWLFGDRYEAKIPLFSPEDAALKIGSIVIQVDPSYAGKAFLRRSMLVLGSGVARTLMLSAVLLVLFYLTLTRPVLAVSNFVRSYKPNDDKRTLEGYDEGKLYGELNLLYRDTQALMTSVDALNHSQEQRVTQRTQQLHLAQQTLDSVTACVMTVDEGMQVLYANRALHELIRQQGYPHGDTQSLAPIAQLMGDVLRAYPELGREIALPHSGAFTKEIALPPWHYTLNVTSVIDAHTQQRVGYSFEWRDQTLERQTEDEVKKAVKAASAGQLSRRLDIATEHAFYSAFSQEINKLMAVNERVIGEVNSALQALASGDLTQNIRTEYEGAFLQLKNHVNATIDKLQDVISEISLTAQTVGQGSQKISEVNGSLQQHNQIFDQQLLGTIGDMQTLTTSIEENSQNIREADAVAQDAKAKAQRGAQATDSVVKAINELQTSSQRIASITDTINDIAFQTNLLSLNAAVEAARAGDMGKGFAVVASEVQSLSIRSSEAAREINTLTRESVGKVAECTRLVEDSGTTLSDIVHAADHVNSVIEKVTSSSARQNQNIESVHHVITDLHRSTENISDLVQSATDTSHEMAERSLHLNQLMRFFHKVRAH